MEIERLRNKRKPSDDEERLRASWADFRAALPTRQACVISLQGIGSECEESRCTCCSAPQPKETKGERSYRCPQCKQVVWVTAKGFFDGIREPVAWRGAIWLFEEGLTPNAADIQRLSGIGYSSAWAMCLKLRMVINEHMTDQGRAIGSGLFCKIFSKRSRETPAREHPLAEQTEVEKAALETRKEPNALVTADSMFDGGRKPEEKEILEHLSQEPLQFDFICQRVGMPINEISAILMMLELTGVVQRLPGDRYSLSKHFLFSGFVCSDDPQLESRPVIASFIEYVRAKFHGISRKYLQIYLAAYWSRLDRVKWGRGQLLKACLAARKIRHKEVLDYVTPERVVMLTA